MPPFPCIPPLPFTEVFPFDIIGGKDFGGWDWDRLAIGLLFEIVLEDVLVLGVRVVLELLVFLLTISDIASYLYSWFTVGVGGSGKLSTESTEGKFGLGIRVWWFCWSSLALGGEVAMALKIKKKYEKLILAVSN